ncbi:MAG: S9 family peptidase [Anaerolineae bacterium]|nr:S9 family peptidase [Anaerolineae bacterium]
MKCTNKTAKPPFQTILVVACVLILTQCSKLPTESEMLPKEAEITGLHDNNLLGTQALASATTSTCMDGTQASGALYRICVPELWNGDLVVWAHGYVAPHEPLRIPEDEADGTSISDIVNQLGFAFATTSFSVNGLAIRQGIADVVDLVDVFVANVGQPGRVYLVGASEGGLITALAVEQFPNKFSGGLAACGPVGSFRKQINYFGDFRVVFDYFFPGVIPGSPVNIPQTVMENWGTIYTPLVIGAITSNPHATEQLLRVTRAPIDSNDPTSVAATVLGILWYNIFATNDAIQKLGGQPFDNTKRLYFGSDNDFRLNREIQRFSAEQAALDEIEAHYQTSGQLDSPVVTLHTTGDPIVPYSHEPLYRLKVFLSGSSAQHANIPVFRYGHCNFRVNEVLAAFAVLVFKATTQNLLVVESMLPEADTRSEFLRLAQEHGARPQLIPRPLQRMARF